MSFLLTIQVWSQQGSKSSLLTEVWKTDDGDLPTKDPKGVENGKEGQETTKDAKGIQTMVRNLLFQAHNSLPSSSGNHPVFVHLLAQAPLGMIE